MKRKLMAALAAGAMLGVLWTASPASADANKEFPPGDSLCSLSQAPSGEFPGANAGEQVNSFKELTGGPPPEQSPASTSTWSTPGQTDLGTGTGFPAVPSVCNPNLNPLEPPA